MDDVKSCQIFLISVSSKCWHLFVPFSSLVDVFLFLVMSRDLFIKLWIFEELCMRLWISFKSYFSWPSLALVLKAMGNVRTECKFIFLLSLLSHWEKERFLLQLSSDEVLTLYQVHSDTTSVKNKKGYFVTLSCEWIPTCSASLKVLSHHLDFFDSPSRWWEAWGDPPWSFTGMGGDGA